MSGDVGDWCWGGGDVCGGIEDSEESCFCVYLGTSFLEYVSTGRVFGCVRIVSNCDIIDFVLLSWTTFAASDFFSTTSSAVASASTSPSLSLWGRNLGNLFLLVIRGIVSAVFAGCVSEGNV